MFQKAERHRTKLRLAISGASGSGKTYSSLLLAQGMRDAGEIKSIAMLDTERSGEIYGSEFDFDVALLLPPFSPQRYIEIIDYAEKNYDLLIIDSLSHAWFGPGGILNMKEDAEGTKGSNSWTAWRKVTPEHDRLIGRIARSSIHTIATMRAKVEYVLEGGGIRKMGLAPVQRDGVDYEFTTTLMMSDDHTATVMTDKTQLFSAGAFVPSIEIGSMICKSLQTGENLMEQFILQINSIETVEELSRWYTKNQNQINGLLPQTEVNSLIELCKTRKEKLSDSGDVGQTDSSTESGKE